MYASHRSTFPGKARNVALTHTNKITEKTYGVGYADLRTAYVVYNTYDFVCVLFYVVINDVL